MQSVFRNYTGQMYDGDAPCGIGHEIEGGGYTQRWACWYGTGETNGDVVLLANIAIDKKISLFVCADTLHIVDIRYAGQTDTWEYCNNGTITAQKGSKLHALENEKIEKILNSPLPGKFWAIVRKRATEIYNRI